MNIYKEFILQLQKVQMSQVFIAVNEDISPKIKFKIKKIIDAKLEDGQYQTFYGEICTTLKCFITLWTTHIDKIIIECDKYQNEVSKEELIHMADHTIHVFQGKQIDFGNEYLPINSPEQKLKYEEIEEMFKQHLTGLAELKEQIEKFDKKDKVELFAKEHFKIQVKADHAVFQFVEKFVALILADYAPKIRASLIDIHSCMHNNLKQLQEQQMKTLNAFIDELYEKNKELIHIYRRQNRVSMGLDENFLQNNLQNNNESFYQLRSTRLPSSSRSLFLEHSENSCQQECSSVTVDIQNAQCYIETIKNKIEELRNRKVFTELEETVTFWQKKIEDFDKIYNVLVKLKSEQDKLNKQTKIYDSLVCSDPPGSKYTCWQNMGENFKQKMELLKEKIVENALALVTFFAIKGNDRMSYGPDEIGPYVTDPFNHQIYIFRSEYLAFHKDCKGGLIKYSGGQKYYYDENNRYVLDENGQKVYQLADCTSQYKLNEDTKLLEKITKDCGHSDQVRKDCKMFYKDPTDNVILPEKIPIDIKETLDPETIKYLWNELGSVLPNALYDVAKTEPRNPIHYLAHRLLAHKYNTTFKEMEQNVKQAEQYRAKIFQERKDKAIAKSKAWKSKQVKRRKPEESDDMEERMKYNEHLDNTQFIQSLNYYMFS